MPLLRYCRLDQQEVSDLLSLCCVWWIRIKEFHVNFPISRSIFAPLLCCDSCYRCIYCYSMYINTGVFTWSLFTSRFVGFCSLISEEILYSTEFLHLSVFNCLLSLYSKWVYLWKHWNKKSAFPGAREPVWANGASTFVARMWVWKDGFVCLLFNVILLSVWKYPNAALQTGMWFSMASQLFWSKTQVTSTVFTEMSSCSSDVLISYSCGHWWK